jgi:hypothetical protein
MLPNLAGQNAFIEITNLEHGGLGWELGTCMWSPEKNKAQQKTWSIMNLIRPGDIIFQFVDLEDGYHWYSVCTAASNLLITDVSPELPGRWEGMHPYQRINLSNYARLQVPYPIKLFLKKYDRRLRNLAKADTHGRFYNAYGGKQLRVAERYAAKCSSKLYKLFQEVSVQLEFDPMFGEEVWVPTEHEPSYADYGQPDRISTMISRIIRDTALSRSINAENRWRCQICGSFITLPDKMRYAEGHHLHPLGSRYEGPDVRGNILVVCPSHHAEFDYGSIAINPKQALLSILIQKIRTTIKNQHTGAAT